MQWHASLKTVILPKHGDSRRDYAFHGAKVLEKIVMPGVTGIEQQMFRNATKLAMVEIPAMEGMGKSANNNTKIRAETGKEST